MSFQSSFTGNQIDTAVGRVTNNEFPSVVSSSLDVNFVGSILNPFGGMDITGNESKYLTNTMVLEPNSRYQFELTSFIIGQVNFVPNKFFIEGQDLNNGLAMLLGSQDKEEVFTSGSRVDFAAPGFIAFGEAYPDTSSFEGGRFIYSKGRVLTGANPTCRFYYWAGEFAGQGNCSIHEFTVKFTKIQNADVQAVDDPAPQSAP